MHVDADAVRNGSLNVIDLLAAVPRERVAAMQATIAQHGHRVVYGMGKGVKGDAIDRLLEVLQSIAQ